MAGPRPAEGAQAKGSPVQLQCKEAQRTEAPAEPHQGTEATCGGSITGQMSRSLNRLCQERQPGEAGQQIQILRLKKEMPR